MITSATVAGLKLQQQFHHTVSERQKGPAMIGCLVKLLRDERGATSIEYAFIASLVSIAAVSLLISIATNLNGTFTTVGRKL